MPTNLDDQTRLELEAAAFRTLVDHMRERDRCAEHRPDEPGRILPELPVQMVHGGSEGKRAWI